MTIHSRCFMEYWKKFSFAIFAFLWVSAASAGEVLMYRDGANWTVKLPNGSLLDISNSQCNGLPEAINYAVHNGHDLKVVGGQIDHEGVDWGVILCYQTLRIPPMQGGVFYFGRITLAFQPNISGDGLVFDSCMMCDFDFRGQVVYSGQGGSAVVFRPQNLLPFDTWTGPVIVDSRFQILTVAHIVGTTQSETAVEFVAQQGSILNNEFKIVELNSETWHGIRVQKPAQGRVFANNMIKVVDVHEQKGMGVINGTGNTDAIFGNYWNMMIRGFQGFLTFAQRDEMHLSLWTASESLKFEASANANLVFLRQITGGINDASTAHNQRIF